MVDVVGTEGYERSFVVWAWRSACECGLGSFGRRWDSTALSVMHAFWCMAEGLLGLHEESESR